MKKTLKKPTILQLAIGLTVSILKSFGKKHTTSEPQMIGKYNLIASIKKTNLFRNYSLGVYKNKNKKAFIKTWIGLVRDFEYYELVNEYLVSKALYKNLKLNGYIKIPKVKDCIAENKSLSIVYEYVEGKPLSDFSLEKQKETLIEVLKYFNNATNSIVSKNNRIFLKRTLFYYVSALTFLSVVTMLSNIRNSRIILRGYFDFLRHIGSIREHKIRIAHRDLVPHNILIKGRFIYLIDCSRVNLTYEGYDIAYITINPKLRKIARAIANALNYSGNTFLENYILVNQANSFGNPIGYKNFYLEELRRRYG